MGEDGARTEWEATRVGAKDQVWGEAGMDPRKKCMKKDDEIADLRHTSLLMVKKESSGRKRGLGKILRQGATYLSTRILTNHW